MCEIEASGLQTAGRGLKRGNKDEDIHLPKEMTKRRKLKGASRRENGPAVL